MIDITECSTFFSNIDSDSKHLYFVLTDIIEDEFLAVNTTTMRSHSDKTVVLDKEHHPFLKHKSSINYSDARLWIVEDYIYFKDIFMIIPCDSKISHETLELIRDGLIKSDFTPKGIQEYYKSYLKQK